MRDAPPPYLSLCVNANEAGVVLYQMQRLTASNKQCETPAGRQSPATLCFFIQSLILHLMEALSYSHKTFPTHR